MVGVALCCIGSAAAQSSEVGAVSTAACVLGPLQEGCPGYIGNTTCFDMSVTSMPDTCFKDDQGDLVTSPAVPWQVWSLPVPKRLGEAAGPLLAYAEGTTGPLTVTGATGASIGGDKTNTSSYPVSTGSCELHAGTERIYDRDRGYAYGGEATADCKGRVSDTNCYVEVWRVRDNTMVENDTTGAGDADGCWALAYHGWYRQATKHYAKAAITMWAGSGGYWGSGRGPEGWDCSGQGTRQLTCDRRTPNEA
jgi:hypothetical protein